MKTFTDLIFESHPNIMMGFSTQATMTFENGYGVSVITGRAAYGSDNAPYELAVLGKDGSLTYDTPITDDVIGHLTPDEVTQLMVKVQKLSA